MSGSSAVAALIEGSAQKEAEVGGRKTKPMSFAARSGLICGSEGESE